MKVYYDIEKFQKVNNAVVTSGTFDGVHKGHQKIIARLKEISNEIDGETVVLTYWPHPRKVLSEGHIAPKILYTIEERVESLKECGIDHLIVIPFTKEFAEISSEEFVKKILVEAIGTKRLIIGYDHRFGRNREGSFEYLQQNSNKYGFVVEEISRQDIDHLTVSSSNIRKALAEGDMDTANEQLGKPFSVSGEVIRGKQLGRTIGYPTANIQLGDEDKIIPRDGVYAVFTIVEGQRFKGMLNIGFNPTVNGTKRTIEVNIFEFDKEIYNYFIKVEFIKYLRSEIKFSGLEELKAQLALDKISTLEVLS